MLAESKHIHCAFIGHPRLPLGPFYYPAPNSNIQYLVTSITKRRGTSESSTMFSKNRSKHKKQQSSGFQLTEESTKSGQKLLTTSRSTSAGSKDSADPSVKVDSKKQSTSAQPKHKAKAGETIDIHRTVIFRASANGKAWFALNKGLESVHIPVELGILDDDYYFKQILSRNFSECTHVHMSIFCYNTGFKHLYKNYFLNRCMSMLAQVADKCTLSFHI